MTTTPHTTEHLVTAVLRLHNRRGRTCGTAFLVTPSLAITCVHVLGAARARPGQTVRLTSHATDTSVDAHVLPNAHYPDADLAFLRLPAPLPDPVAPAAFAPSAGLAGAPVRAFGYPSLGNMDGLWGTGELVGPVTEAGRPLLQLRSTQITAGFSGGPVWEATAGRAVGMVISVTAPDHLARLSDVAFAVPSETIRDLSPEGLDLRPIEVTPPPHAVPAPFAGLTATIHELAFDRLSPRDFERMCLWLVQREGFDRAEHLGAAGREQGRDIVAWHEGQLWAFQCKRVQHFYPKDAEDEVDKVLGLPDDLRPVALVFLVACDVSDETRQRARARCPRDMECHFWALTELDERVKRHSDIVQEFFHVPMRKREDLRDEELPSPEAIAHHRAALREQLDTAARARWNGMSSYVQEEGTQLPIQASPYDTGRLGSRQNLLRLLHEAHRLMVLGGPGSGKTVSLERLAWELCATPQPVVPVLVPLFHYNGDPLVHWVRLALHQTGHLRLDQDRALDAFLTAEGDVRCFFLFDGLNEVPPRHRDQLTRELVHWMIQYSRHPVVLTSRPQDELWRQLRPDMSQVVVVQPITDHKARDYLVAHLGEQGDALYESLDDRLRTMARTPLILRLIKEAGAAGESVPGNRGELYACFVSCILRRDTARRMDADIPELTKRQALGHLAYYLGLRQRLSCPRHEAVRVVARRLGHEQAEQVLAACGRHGLLAGDDPLWFAPHPTMQEHFAALALRKLVEHKWRLRWWARLQRSARRLLSRKDKGLASLAADGWWMDTFVQLAGLVDDPDELVLQIARVESWTAWWCVEEGQEVAEETREAVADRSVRRLQSKRVADRRRAVAALAQMRSKRVVRPLLRAAADPDPEAAGLALQALLEMDEVVRLPVEEALRGADRRLRLAALRYLVERPKDPLCQQVPWEQILGQPMVWVPPGPFLMGSNNSQDPRAHHGELPQHEVTLPGYWIGRYPVTVAQFRAFVEASGHQPERHRTVDRPPDHPMMYVTWWAALAFCRWLSERAGVSVMLPSEAEWEKAARGTDGRIYPWGNQPPDETRCTFGDEARGTTPVGQHSPKWDSPYGCADMAGNVWEWTRSLWGKEWDKPQFGYPYDPGDGREDLGAGQDVRRVLRGGAFCNGARRVRCAFRNRVHPVSHSGRRYGFRVCIASLQEPHHQAHRPGL